MQFWIWKSAYVGVYQLLNWKIHGETLKFYSYVTEKMHEIYKMQQTTNVKQDMHCHYSCTEDDIKEQNVPMPKEYWSKMEEFYR